MGIGNLAKMALLGLAMISAHLAVGRELHAQEYARTTVTYKTVNDLDIKADIYRPDDQVRRAVVVWIHGGALIMGHRENVPGPLLEYAKKRGFAVVSIDYRLAPESKLDEIISDLEAALAWIRSDKAEEYFFDTNRIAVTGGSAGGYLTLMSGFRAESPPQALVAFWGYGDLIGEWLTTPSPHPAHNWKKFSREDALGEVDGEPISDARERDGNGGAFYAYCRQNGRWPLEVAGWDPAREPEKFTPFMPLKNVTPTFPPTFLLHGTADTDVPFEQSEMMAAELKSHGVAHELTAIEGAEHGLRGGDPEQISAAFEAIWMFLDRHLEASED